MTRKLTLLLIALLATFSLQAQYDTLTIQQIQMVTPQDLAACNDLSPFDGDTVVVFGLCKFSLYGLLQALIYALRATRNKYTFIFISALSSLFWRRLFREKKPLSFGKQCLGLLCRFLLLSFHGHFCEG